MPNPCNNLIIVDKKSDIDLHREVFKIAKYFSEDLNYNTIPPYPPLGVRDKDHTALLFTTEATDLGKAESMSYRIFGSCLFRRQHFTEAEDCWVLEWIWFHPFFRRKGNLTKYWAYLERKFGDFLINEPESNDMVAFLDRTDPNNKHVRL
jgi:hypothetical protein